jgi:hypothetical protein
MVPASLLPRYQTYTEPLQSFPEPVICLANEPSAQSSPRIGKQIGYKPAFKAQVRYSGEIRWGTEQRTTAGSHWASIPGVHKGSQLSTAHQSVG